jgi:hypothetical protein
MRLIMLVSVDADAYGSQANDRDVAMARRVLEECARAIGMSLRARSIPDEAGFSDLWASEDDGRHGGDWDMSGPAANILCGGLPDWTARHLPRARRLMREALAAGRGDWASEDDALC